MSLSRVITGGNIKMAKWLIELGVRAEDTFYAASILMIADEKILEIFEYLRSNRLPLPARIFDAIAQTGKLKLVEWLLVNDYKGDKAVQYNTIQKSLFKSK